MKQIPTPMKSIRLKCLDCCAGSANEVRLCPCKECALWPYRYGRRPTTVARKEAARLAGEGVASPMVGETKPIKRENPTPERIKNADGIASLSLGSKKGGFKVFVYGMKLRGFSPGCQPMAGLVKYAPDPTGRFYDLLFYTYLLSADDMAQYDLVFLKEVREDD